MPARDTASTPRELAREFIDACRAAGFGWSVRDTIVTVSKTFTPGDRDAFVECDVTAPHLLSLVPRSSAGSTWGTDGGSVGGMIALENGRFVLNRSGCNKRVVKALVEARR